MNLADYFAQSLTVFFMGFFPYAEIYLAIPAGLALGLDPVSTVAFGVMGNFAPIPFIHYSYEQLFRIPRLSRWLDCLASERVKRKVEKGGFWFYLLMTPVLGTWGMGLALKLLQIPPHRFFVPTFLSVIIAAILIALLVVLGVDWLMPKDEI